MSTRNSVGVALQQLYQKVEGRRTLSADALILGGIYRIVHDQSRLKKRWQSCVVYGMTSAGIWLGVNIPAQKDSHNCCMAAT